MHAAGGMEWGGRQKSQRKGWLQANGVGCSRGQRITKGLMEGQVSISQLIGLGDGGPLLAVWESVQTGCGVPWGQRGFHIIRLNPCIQRHKLSAKITRKCEQLFFSSFMMVGQWYWQLLYINWRWKKKMLKQWLTRLHVHQRRHGPQRLWEWLSLLWLGQSAHSGSYGHGFMTG